VGHPPHPLPDPTSPTSPGDTGETSEMPRYPAVRSSTGSSDSQHDIPTAVNTPWAHTPSCSTGDLTRGKDKDDKDWESPAEMTQEEMELRERSKEEGKAEHQGEVGVGVNERKEMLDLGNGLEEVIIIDWLPVDPEVCGDRVKRS
jgi:hypothetical protein